MNIRDRKTLPALMTLLGLMGALTSCHREDAPTPAYRSDIPISFAPSSGWSDIAKADIYDQTTDLQGDGIAVWGTLSATNPDNTISVFKGTYASYPDWNYGKARYWQLGSYTFASVLPASAFKANVEQEDGTATESHGKYTADWNDSSKEWTFLPAFDLSDQIDLMTAYAAREFTLEHVNGKPIGAVELQFNHTLSLLNISIANGLENAAITVNSVKIHGPHTTASSLSEDGTWTDYGEASTPESPFHSEDLKLSLSAAASNPLTESLLVFPEKSSMMCIEVNYTEKLSEAENTITRTAQIQMDWHAGRTYTYQLKVSPSSLLVLKHADSGWTDVTVNHPSFD